MATHHSRSEQSELALSTDIGERLPPDTVPLYESIDPDALDELFAKNDTDGTIQFNHAGYRIVVQFENGSRTVAVEQT